jgi:tRNA threonylcarbamoyladenosine biosynthesis protein TsaE
MATFTSHSPEETLALGEAWGRAARRGDVFALSGDLGAGKTQLVKGIARGLGSAARVHSPTFTLLNQYDGGRLPLFHLDLYRLDSPQQVIGAGLEPYLLNPDGVTVVEWAERWFGECGMRNAERGTERVRWVRLEVAGEMERRITYDDSGA